jgi:quinol monooxygenase YgiN
MKNRRIAWIAVQVAAVSTLFAALAWTAGRSVHAQDSDASIPVIGIVTAKPGKASALESLLRADFPLSLKDAGMLRYELNRSASDPNTFMFNERWTSQEALNAHLHSSHVGTLLQSLFPKGMEAGSDILAGPPSLQVFKLLK